jgi:pilus assembly protein Flp/PilA
MGTSLMLEHLRSITQRNDQDGASAVDYGLLIAGIAALIVAMVFVFGGAVSKSFKNSCGKFSAGSSATSTSTC